MLVNDENNTNLSKLLYLKQGTQVRELINDNNAWREQRLQHTYDENVHEPCYL